MARVGSSEVVVDGRGVAGGLPGVAHVVQADGPEHHLGRVMNGDTVLLELLKVGGKLVGRHATQGGLDGLVSDLVGRRGSGGGALIGAVDEDPVANEVVAIDRWEPRAGRRVRERGPGRVKDRQTVPQLQTRVSDLDGDHRRDLGCVALWPLVGEKGKVDVADHGAKPSVGQAADRIGRHQPVTEPKARAAHSGIDDAPPLLSPWFPRPVGHRRGLCRGQVC